MKCLFVNQLVCQPTGRGKSLVFQALAASYLDCWTTTTLLLIKTRRDVVYTQMSILIFRSFYKNGLFYKNDYSSLGPISFTIKLLGVTIDRQLKFDSHVLNICSKAGRKLSVQTRMTKYLSFDKKKIIMKTFFESQFKYCPLTWMFHSRKLNNKINSLQERALRLVYNDFNSSLRT